MTRRLLASYLTITAFALVVLVVPLGLSFAGRERDRLLVAVERDATTVAALAEDALEAGQPPALLASVLAGYAGDGGRVVVVDRRGFSVADTDAPGIVGSDVRDFSTRPEFQTALAGGRASGIRASETLGHGLLYVAVPVSSGGTVHGAVRVTFPSSTVDARVRDNWLRLAALAALVLGAVTGVGLVLARSVTRPVRQIDLASRRLAGGDLAARVPAPHGAPELRALASTFNAMAERLEDLVSAQRQFVADASHQLRTPLTALRLRLEILEGGLRGPQRARAEAALQETARLGRLVEALLALARADAGPPAAAVDLSAAVRERVAVWREVAERQGVELVLVDAEGAAVSAVGGAIEQVLDNLIANALHASPRGSRVSVSVRPGPVMTEVHVLDEGPGMTDEERAHAFDRFWRPAQATTPGFGLGLAIVRQLVGSSGGEVRLDSNPAGRGLDAVVRLPAAATGDAVAPPPLVGTG